LFTGINQLTGCGKCRFDQAHDISKASCIVCRRDNRHNCIDLKALARRCARILSMGVGLARFCQG
jgi:hypothetical protein